ncbi:MAG TPA: pyridoxal phosphate-dependent aminotransferase [Bryobacteraceae bacterium]|jgi:histidinol-phosphate/aromatic aminotransferase/cobyric acid decarboxylase-like protein|nr:pyridoxal phosphate-dependent aminotransferase [Bryobacteraceae bacterium]
MTLSPEQRREFIQRGFSRRSFGKIATVIAAGSTLPFYNEPALAQLSRVENVPPDAVMINANENPLGPCAEARDAVHSIVAQGGRYMYGETDKVAKLLSQQEGVKLNYIRIYPGSSAPLHQSVLAFTSPSKPLVTADPGYEAGERAARFIGAKTIKVPLTKDYKHDVKAMAAASPDAGLIYICNPNNPTGTLTPKEDIEWLVANKPKGAVVMIDEAYTHIAGAPFNTDLVAQDKDVVVLRTFSKIYGMAGLRAGAAIARPDLIEKLGGFSAGMLPITGMAAASTSLQQANLVPERRKLIGGVREDTFSFLEKNKFTYVQSVSNCFMVDVKQPGMNTIMALRKEKVYIGRVWPAWPTYVRVTVGTKDEMAKFQAAFLKVMA